MGKGPPLNFPQLVDNVAYYLFFVKAFQTTSKFL